MKAEQLRKSILQMAIQGKLVPQDPMDEPASVLLEKIRAEKQRLIKEGKIKKDKVDSIIFKGDDNRYYEKIGNENLHLQELDEVKLPENWRVCRLSSIANIFTGNSINEQEKAKKYTGLSQGYNYIGTKDVSFDHSINYTNGVKTPFDTQFKIAHKGTPLLCIEGGSAGRKIGIINEDVCFGNKLCAFETYGINSLYLYYFLQNPAFIDVFKSNTTGIIGGVSVNTIKSLFFFVPPLAEQERIVAEIEKYEPLILEYDKLEQQKTKLDSEIYDKLKKSILLYAIQGKLVSQDPNDEPASILLEKIRTEKKAKLGKKYVDSYIYKGDDNCYYEHINGNSTDISYKIPFEIPETWEWIRLPYIAINDLGKTLNSEKDSGESVPYLCSINVYWDGIKIDKIKTAIFSNDEKSKYKLEHGDLLICEGGEAGRCAVWEENSTMYYQNALHRVRFDKNIIPYFYKIVIEAYYRSGIINNYCKGVTIKHLVQSSLISIYLPLPPFAEQRRIVNKLNEIFAKL